MPSNTAQHSSPTALSPIIIESYPRQEDANESDDSQELEDEAQLSDFDEFEAASPTLTRFKEDDVAVDMDELI